MRNNITISMNVNGDGTQIIDNTFLGGVSVVGSHNSVAKNTIGGGVETDGSYNLIADNSVSGERGLYTVDVHDNSSVIFNNSISGGDWPAIHLGYGSRDNLIAKNNLTSGGMELESYSSFNTVCANNLNGWGLALMGFNNTFYANQLGHVGIGGTHGGTVDAAYNRFYHNNFIGDSPELSVYTKVPGPLFWDDGKEGNYWSNYKGSGNKVGTTPYQVYGDYHYFDGAIREDTMVNCGQDNHPLLNLFNVDSVNVALPEWASHLVIEISPPRIAILLLENQTYNQCSVPLGFSLNKPVLWMGYSLDGQENVTVAGNTTLAGLANGNHNVTVYAEDEAGNSGASETLFFSVNVPEPEPSSEIVPVAAVSLAVATVAAAGLFLYGRKRKRAPAKL